MSGGTSLITVPVSRGESGEEAAMVGRLMRWRLLVVAVMLVGLVPALVAAQEATPGADMASPGASGGLVAPDVTVETVPPAVEQTKGPNGEEAGSYQDVRLTAEEVEQVRQ